MSKKSFYLFHDSLDILNDLTDEQAGKLFKAIYNFNIGIDTELDPVLKMCFLPFRNQFVRDLDAYNKKCEKNKLNGINGGRPSKTEITEPNRNNPVGYLKPNRTEITQTPHDKDTDTDTDTEKDNDKKTTFVRFWNLYDKKVSRDKCEKIWAKLSEKDIEKIFETLPAFIASIKDKQFQPHPATYLNQKRWNDEIAGPAPVKNEIDKMHNRDLYYSHNEYINICRAKKVEPIITIEEFYAK